MAWYRQIFGWTVVLGAVQRGLVALALLAAFVTTAAAQSWVYVTDIVHPDGQLTNAAAIQIDTELLGLMLDRTSESYVLFISAPRIDKTDKISVRVRADGNWQIINFFADEITRERDVGNNTEDAFVTIQPEFLDLLMGGDLIRLRVGADVFSFPLTDSRAAITRLIDWGETFVSIDDIQHTNVQALSDCDQQAAHPWDQQARDVDGTLWSDLDAEIAIDTCRYAVANSKGPERTRALYQLGRALDKAGDPESLTAIFEAGEEYDYAAALNHLGVFYEDGDYVDRDKDHALSLFERAARRGFVPAMLNYADIALESEPHGNDLAYEYMRDAADAEYPRAMELFGIAILDGHVTEYAASRAVSYLEKASGHNRSGATMQLARIYRDGLGQDKSPTEYLRYLRLAADQGNEDARAALGQN